LLLFLFSFFNYSDEFDLLWWIWMMIYTKRTQEK
jgi:hypothetical protein